ncbi:MAG: hypothetical protein ACREUT_07505 [Steroidobacteraceae bacterium]
MKAIVITTRVILSLLGIALIVLGVLFWIGQALSLLPLHMLLGGIFVLCMWLLAGLALFARRAYALAAVVFVWGVIVPIFGMEQLRLMPGSLHWVVQAVHLLVGLIAIGLGHALAAKILRPRAPSPELASNLK